MYLFAPAYRSLSYSHIWCSHCNQIPHFDRAVLSNVSRDEPSLAKPDDIDLFDLKSGVFKQCFACHLCLCVESFDDRSLNSISDLNTLNRCPKIARENLRQVLVVPAVIMHSVEVGCWYCGAHLGKSKGETKKLHNSFV